jgi:4-carboxymuconolactone decarboxylase
MARVPLIHNREDVNPSYRDVFDEIASSRDGEITGPYQGLLYSPIPAARTAHLGAYVRFESTLPDIVLSLTAMTVAREYDCHYEWAVNEIGAERVGVRTEAIEAIKHNRAPDGLTAEEVLVFNFARELLQQHRVSEETWDAAVARYGLKAVTDIVVAIGYYTCIAMALNAFEVDDPPQRPSTLPV